MECCNINLPEEPFKCKAVSSSDQKYFIDLQGNVYENWDNITGKGIGYVGKGVIEGNQINITYGRQ